MSKYREDYYNDNYIEGEQYNEESEIPDNEEYYYPEEEENLSKRAPRENIARVNKKRKSGFKGFIFKLLAVILTLFLSIVAIGFFLSLFLPANTNVLIMATDEDGTRTDTIMLASFNKDSKSLSFTSIPRDTYVSVDDEAYALMREEYPKASLKSMKINAVHHFGGEKYGRELLIDQVETLLGISVDFYVKVDFEAFRYVIDSVGGIDFYVPCDMRYSDPTQNLYIDLKEGMQHLDGEKAEHVLRFRSGYANADIGRVSVQQDFMKEFISQTFSKGTILTHPFTYINTIFKYNYVETDAGFFDIVAYALLAGGIDMENIKTATLPGSPAMRGGQSVYLPKVAEIEELISEISGS